MTTPTPRTDEVGSEDSQGSHLDFLAMRKLAAQLERELAAAQERIQELETALLGVKEYREKNPLGGPAKVFDAMADAIRAGDDFNAVCSDYGWCYVERAKAAEARAEANERDAAMGRIFMRYIDRLSDPTDDDPLIEIMRLAIRAAVAAEQERAARVCEMVAGQYTSNPFGSVAKNCAAAIRKGE